MPADERHSCELCFNWQLSPNEPGWVCIVLDNAERWVCYSCQREHQYSFTSPSDWLWEVLDGLEDDGHAPSTYPPVPLLHEPELIEPVQRLMGLANGAKDIGTADLFELAPGLRSAMAYTASGPGVWDSDRAELTWLQEEASERQFQIEKAAGDGLKGLGTRILPIIIADMERNLASGLLGLASQFLPTMGPDARAAVPMILAGFSGLHSTSYPIAVGLLNELDGDNWHISALVRKHLHRAFRDRWPESRRSAALALGSIQHRLPVAKTWLQELSRDPEPKVRGEAMALLEVSDFICALNDSDSGVRSRAVRALGRAAVTDQAALRSLASNLDTDNVKFRREVAWELNRLTGRLDTLPGLSERVQAILGESSDR